MGYVQIFLEAVGAVTTLAACGLGLLVLSGRVKVGVKKLEDDDE